ncbi:DUF4974 domain-containing protein [Olivibacter ginsenosidimutans]|uniref:DUF4974 domain-containing protein n=2 Tax=Olivibacter ginsenosidimutans TaxID=1176537 RepID=A0ABP9CE22_9SPHI
MTPEEEQEFFSRLWADHPEEELNTVLRKVFDEHQTQHTFFTEQETERMLAHIKKKSGLRRVGNYRSFWRYAAAVFLVLGAAFFLHHTLMKRNLFTPMAEKVVVTKDVAPGNEKAIITLADGSKIDVDQVANGTFDDHGNTFLKEKKGLLNYTANQANGQDVAYHTMTIPKGGQYQLVLADGTKVWLNAASSLHYPTQFKGTVREVSVTGEAYFEVAHHPEKPFLVTCHGQTIRVLGTHFNVRAYPDEPSVKTTLLTGSISLLTKASTNQEALKLQPGDEATQQANGEINVKHLTNAAMSVAWTEGYFAFYHSDLENVLRELSRWYNVDFKIKAKTSKTYTGRIDRQLTLAELMNGLQLSGVPIQIEDKHNIIVLPNK